MGHIPCVARSANSSNRSYYTGPRLTTPIIRHMRPAIRRTLFWSGVDWPRSLPLSPRTTANSSRVRLLPLSSPARRFGYRSDLRIDPWIQPSNPLRETCLGPPSQRFDPRLVEVPRPHSPWPFHRLPACLLARHFDDHVHQLGHRHMLVATDVPRPLQVGLHQLVDSVHQIIHVRVVADRGPVTPDFNRSAILGFRDFATDRGRRLLSPPVPSAFRAVAVLVARDADAHCVTTAIRHGHPLG